MSALVRVWSLCRLIFHWLVDLLQETSQSIKKPFTMKFAFLQYSLLFASASAFAPSQSIQTTRHVSVAPVSMSSEALEAPPMSPLTQWGDKISDIRQVQQAMRKQKLPEFAPEISAKSLGLEGNTDAQLEYFKDNAMELKKKMERHGAVVFRGFDLMKSQDGFQQFYKAVGMKTCLDPLHSVSARPTVDGNKNSPVYEAVNKESRKNFFIGKT